MAKQTSYMSGDEFVAKIIDGERTFRGFYIQDMFNLRGHQRYGELQDRLNAQGGAALDLRGVSLVGVHAPQLYLPHVQADGADFRHACLDGANLEKSVLCGANFLGASLKNASLQNADLFGTQFRMTDLTGVLHLDSAYNLAAAIFHRPIADPVNRAIIMDAMVEASGMAKEEWVRVLSSQLSRR